MAATTTSVVVVIILILTVYLVFEAVSRGVPEDKDSEVEVGLFPPKIRRKISEPSRDTPGSAARTSTRGKAERFVDRAAPNEAQIAARARRQQR